MQETHGSVGQKPVPVAGELNGSYWANANARCLVAQRCLACSYYLGVQGELLCPQCGSESLEWQELSGHARLHSYAVAQQTTTQGFENDLPYVVILAEAVEQEGLIIMTNLVGDFSYDELTLDAPLIVDFEERAGQLIPQFRVDRTRDAAK